MTFLQTLPLLKTEKKGWPWTEETNPQIYDKHKQWPKISIIIPSYNQAAYIEETIRSILLQNYPNFELIIMDGNSNDGSVDIIKQYESWITYWESVEDNGQSHAINKGINLLTGDIVNWINSDDSLAKNAFFEIGNFFLKNPEVDIIFGNCNVIYPSIKTDLYQAVDFDEVDFVSRISVHQPSTFWKTKLFGVVGKLDESYHYCMDYDFWARIVFNNKSAKLDKTLSNFRRYPESKSSNFKDQTNIYMDYRRVVSIILSSIDEQFIPKLKELGIFYNEELKKYHYLHKYDNELKTKMLNRYIMTFAAQEYLLGHKKKANHLLKVCFTKENYKEALGYLIKNNIGYRKIFHPYRKSNL